MLTPSDLNSNVMLKHWFPKCSNKKGYFIPLIYCYFRWKGSLNRDTFPGGRALWPSCRFCPAPESPWLCRPPDRRSGRSATCPQTGWWTRCRPGCSSPVRRQHTSSCKRYPQCTGIRFRNNRNSQKYKYNYKMWNMIFINFTFIFSSWIRLP